jgi:hypothetical protein
MSTSAIRVGLPSSVVARLQTGFFKPPIRMVSVSTRARVSAPPFTTVGRGNQERAFIAKIPTRPLEGVPTTSMPCQEGIWPNSDAIANTTACSGSTRLEAVAMTWLGSCDATTATLSRRNELGVSRRCLAVRASRRSDLNHTRGGSAGVNRCNTANAELGEAGRCWRPSSSCDDFFKRHPVRGDAVVRRFASPAWPTADQSTGPSVKKVEPR